MKKQFKKIKNNVAGFTIIETMIVLAIAALIMLIVFLAVPALQRAQRNTSTKDDAGRIATAVSTFESDNNGQMPCFTGSTFNVSAAASAATPPVNDAQTIINDVGTLAQMTINKYECSQSPDWQQGLFDIVEPLNDVGASSSSWPGEPTTLTDSMVLLFEGGSCSDGSVVPSNNDRAAALVFTVDNGGSYGTTCIQAT